MSKKISQLAFTSSIDPTDEFVINASGTNKRIFRDALFAAGGSVTFGISSGGAFVGVRNDDCVQLSVAAGNQFFFFQNTTQWLTLDASGDLTIAPDGNVSIQPGAGGIIDINYVPVTSGNWAGDPDDIWEALDRIADVVSNSGANPIP